uniref:Uncharacterized protein n=1 Tax=Trichogramma kaykai TaxID=54128 RepID=A0ABD2VXV9_9HYME
MAAHSHRHIHCATDIIFTKISAKILGASKVYITATRGVRYFLSCPSRLSLRTMAHGNSEACAARSCLIKMPPRKGDELLRFRSCCSSRKFGRENYQLWRSFPSGPAREGERIALKGKRRIRGERVRQQQEVQSEQSRGRPRGMGISFPRYYGVFFPRVVVQQYYMYLLLTARKRRALVHYNDGAVLLRLKLELRSTDTYFGRKHDYLYTNVRSSSSSRESFKVLWLYITPRLSCFLTHIHTATVARICEIKFDEFLFRSAAAAM